LWTFDGHGRHYIEHKPTLMDANKIIERPVMGERSLVPHEVFQP
jgi:hypothetical protein